MSSDPVKMVRAVLEGLPVGDGTTLATCRVLTVQALDHLPVVHVAAAGGGSQTDIDRLDRISAIVYAQAPTTDGAPTAVSIAELAHAALVGGPHDTPAGYIDEVRAESLPTGQPYTDTVDTAAAVYGVVHRFL
ncbi:hypothetical protein [Actinomyces qiguomingii]|uniref:hypothetical protein n=1 Tax=Actinomyces qiguomingii TaxID=2057800 RepID=UPI000FFE5E18|nr:hypothetical protein [Actinomyces qiguomingii]